jgi:hypothetical protein
LQEVEGEQPRRGREGQEGVGGALLLLRQKGRSLVCLRRELLRYQLSMARFQLLGPARRRTPGPTRVSPLHRSTRNINNNKPPPRLFHTHRSAPASLSFLFSPPRNLFPIKPSKPRPKSPRSSPCRPLFSSISHAQPRPRNNKRSLRKRKRRRISPQWPSPLLLQANSAATSGTVPEDRHNL